MASVVTNFFQPSLAFVLRLLKSRRVASNKLLLFWKCKAPSHWMEDALGYIFVLLYLRLFKCYGGFLCFVSLFVASIFFSRAPLLQTKCFSLVITGLRAMLAEWASFILRAVLVHPPAALKCQNAPMFLLCGWCEQRGHSGQLSNACFLWMQLPGYLSVCCWG